jgi:large subunit ribosomal protein L19
MSVVAEFSSKYTKNVPPLRTGLTVRVHQKIQEGGKTRIQVFEGLIIRISPGSGSDRTFTVRKVVDGVGVEKIFPLHSSNIAKIEVKKVHKTRRSKLYYMRERQGKSANLRDLRVDLSKYAVEEPVVEEKAEDTAPAEETPAVPEEKPTEETAPVEEAQPTEKVPAEETPPAEEKPTESTPAEGESKEEAQPAEPAAEPEEKPEEEKSE